MQDDLIKYFDKISKALKSERFFNFIADKSRKVLDEVTRANLNLNDNEEYEGTYRNSHQVKVDEQTITIFNQSEIPVSALNPEIAENYPDGFDLAKAVEYGTGIVGASSNASGEAQKDGWQYDVNSHGNQGWFYEKDGTRYWTKGMSGKLIYYQTKEKIENEVNNWIEEFIEEIV